MFIERLDIIRIKNPFASPFETSFVKFVERDALIVKVYAKGHVGYGECKAFFAPLYNPEDNGTCMHIIKNVIAPLILGKEIEGPEDFMNKVSFIRGNKLAKAAVENALWDIEVKSSGKSLKTLLGGTRSEIEIGISLGIQPSIEALLQKVENAQQVGYKRTKIKIKPGWDYEVVKTVREAFPEIVLTIDANSAYTLDDIQLFKSMDPFNLTFIEQPLAENDIIDHAKLQKEIQTAICLDESIESVEDARQAIELGSCRVINIKSSRCGGIHEAVKIHDFCMAHDIPVWCGGMTETGVGRVQNIALASLPNFSLAHDIAPSARYFEKDIVQPYVEMTPAGMMLVPDENNGISYEVDEEAIDRIAVTKEILRA